MTKKRWLIVSGLLAVLGACSDAGPSDSERPDAGGAADVAAPRVTEVWMSPTELRLAVGESATVSASARDVAQAEVEDAEIVWSSSDTDVVRVDQQGHLDAIGPGTVYVKAAVGEAVGRTAVEVYESVDVVEIAWSGQTVYPGKTFEPELKLYSTFGNELSPADWVVRWASIDSDIVEHLGEGRFLALQPGAAEIAVVVNEVRATATVGVGEYRDLEIHISAANRVRRGESVPLTAAVYGPGGEYELPHIPIEWTSSDPSVLEVASDATAHGRAVGKATVSASALDLVAEQEMLVYGAFSQVDAGRRHACGLYEGIAVCWGENRAGQLGTDDLVSRARPTQVAGAHDFVQISAGGDFTCALEADGQAFCWGANDDGQLGDGTRISRARPTAIDTDIRFVAISAGFAHACGLDAQGAAFCWGSGEDGRLGTGTTDDSLRPAAVVGDHTFETISAGEHTCAIDAAGAEVFCWGDNDHGEIGRSPPLGPHDDSGTPWSAEPLRLMTSKTFADVDAGNDFSCGLAVDDQVYCWGSNRDDQLGRTIYMPEASYPVSLHEDPVYYSALTAAYHPCAIREGMVYCWREDFHGDPTTSGVAHVESPVKLTGVGGVASLTTGYKFSCALDESGDVYCSGWGNEGVLGGGSMNESSRRIFIPVGLPDIAALR